MILRALILVCGCLSLGFGAMPTARGENVVIGVNVVNPQRLRPADRETVLAELQAAGVRVIRAPLAPPWGGGDYAPAIDFIRRAYERGIKTDLIIGLEYRDGAQKRPPFKALPNMWSSYPLSSADPVRFRAVFTALFDRLESMGLVFAALELGNEINWTAFNGDFPIPGEGRVFDGYDLTHDPEAQRIADGYRSYLQTLQVLKDIRDHSRLNQATPILSAGLSDPGPAGPRPGSKTDAVTIGATLEYLRAHGIDALVDAYGVHTYPSSAVSAAARLGRLEHDTFAECQPPSQGKPCWLTEWGLPAENTLCPDTDAARAGLAREMLADFGQFVRQGRLMALLYFAWTDGKYGALRCGAMTESGRLILSSRTPQ